VAIVYVYNSNFQHYISARLKFVHNPTLLSVTTSSMVRYEGKDPQLTGELVFPSVMRTERCFSSSGLLEMLPIYRLRLMILGVYGQ
jgi:hypothetical protein